MATKRKKTTDRSASPAQDSAAPAPDDSAIALSQCLENIAWLDEKGRRRVVAGLRSFVHGDALENLQPFIKPLVEKTLPDLLQSLVRGAIPFGTPPIVGHIGRPDLPPLDEADASVMHPSAADLRQDLVAWVSSLAPEAYQDAANALGSEKVRELMQLLGIPDPSSSLQPQEPASGEDGWMPDEQT